MLKRAFQRAAKVVDRLPKMIWGWTTSRIFMLPGTKIDYEAEVGDGTKSDIVMAPVQWMMRTFPEAPLGLCREMEGEDEPTIVKNHKALKLLKRPNAYYSSKTLWMSTILSYAVDGNAYWIKIRNNDGLPGELWWVPHTLMAPLEPGTLGELPEEFIDYYCYSVPGLNPVLIKPSEVVHFRFGNDVENPRMGLSPLKSAVREIYSDSEAANWTASLLKNAAVPGLIVSPDSQLPIKPGDVEEVRAYFDESYTGDNRGKPHVMRGPTKLMQFGFSPEQMNLKDIRRLPEERVCALLGIPAIVAGVGAGLDRSTFANMAEAREMAYESNIIPTQALFAETLNEQLLFEYSKETKKKKGYGDVEFYFNTSNVRVLQEDENQKTQRWNSKVEAGWAMVSEARKADGMSVSVSHNVFLRDANKVEVPDGVIRPLLDPNADSNSSNGKDKEKEKEEKFRSDLESHLKNQEIIDKLELSLKEVVQDALREIETKFNQMEASIEAGKHLDNPDQEGRKQTKLEDEVQRNHNGRGALAKDSRTIGLPNDDASGASGDGSQGGGDSISPEPPGTRGPPPADGEGPTTQEEVEDQQLTLSEEELNDPKGSEEHQPDSEQDQESVEPSPEVATDSLLHNRSDEPNENDPSEGGQEGNSHNEEGSLESNDGQQRESDLGVSDDKPDNDDGGGDIDDDKGPTDSGDDDEPPPSPASASSPPQESSDSTQEEGLYPQEDVMEVKKNNDGEWEVKKPSRRQESLIRKFNEAIPALSFPLEKNLKKSLGELGDIAGARFIENSGSIVRFNSNGEVTILPSGINNLVTSMDIPEWGNNKIISHLEDNSKRVIDNTVETINNISRVGVNIPDDVARNLIRRGGRRIGLMDLDRTTKNSIFSSLYESRKMGEGIDAMGERIKQYVSAGRYTNKGAGYRAKLIAQTETRWAQNMSSIEAYEYSDDIGGMLAFDAQKGAERSDWDCIMRNGRQYTTSQARLESAREHPEGTLSWAPVPISEFRGPSGPIRHKTPSRKSLNKEIKQIIKKNPLPYGDRWLSDYANARWGQQKARIVGAEEFLSNKNEAIFRGMNNEQALWKTINGEHSGLGWWGNGHYYASGWNRQGAFWYAGDNHGSWVMASKLDETTNLVKWEKLKDDYIKATGKNPIISDSIKGLQWDDDIGRWAAHEGYDAIQVFEEGEIVVLNQRKLIIDERTIPGGEFYRKTGEGLVDTDDYYHLLDRSEEWLRMEIRVTELIEEIISKKGMAPSQLIEWLKMELQAKKIGKDATEFFARRQAQLDRYAEILLEDNGVVPGTQYTDITARPIGAVVNVH